MSKRDSTGISHRRRPIGAWVWLGLLAVATVLAVRHYRDELAHIVRVLAGASPAGTAVAVLCELAFIAVYWDLVRRLYRAAGTPVAGGALFRLLLIAGVVDRLLPTAGTSGIAVLALSGARWGITWASTLWMTALHTVLGLLATAVIVAASVFLLSIWDIALPPSVQRALTAGRWATAAALVAGIAFLWDPVRHRAVRFAIRIAGAAVRWWRRSRAAFRFLRKRKGVRELAPAETGPARPSPRGTQGRRRRWNEQEQFAAFEATWERIRRNPGLWAVAFLENLALYGFRIGTLAALMAALHITLPWSHLIAGYGLVVLLVNLSALPFSLGVFEVSMAALYHWLGMPWAQAWALTLAYRGITFWLPIPLGLLAMIRRKEHPQPSPGEEGNRAARRL